jgi:hypothetical protein
MKGIRLVVVALAILGLSIAVIPPLSEVSQMGSTWRKDGKYVPALQNISALIPENESLVTASYDPATYYFTDRHLQIPIRGSTYNSVVNFMIKNNYSYLLVIEGQHNVPRGFEFKTKLTDFKGDFIEIAVFKTDFKTISLYKRIT